VPRLPRTKSLHGFLSAAGLIISTSTPALCEPVSAVMQGTAPAPRQYTQLADVLQSEVDAYVSKLKDAQQRLRLSGQSSTMPNQGIYFGLQMGAPAVYDATNLTPRSVFLDFNFATPVEARQTRTLAGSRAIRLV
jgi:hypothetical protein